MTNPKYIVAEVSKNWEDGEETAPTGPLCTQFERILEVNRIRGYKLYQFQVVRMAFGPGRLNETLIAVFEREGHADE